MKIQLKLPAKTRVCETIVFMRMRLVVAIRNLSILPDEKRLIKRLLDRYEHVGVIGRPVYNTSQTVKVSYGMSLIQILDVDEKNQVLTINVWSRYVRSLLIYFLTE